MSLSFDPNDYAAEKKSYDPVPKGKYCVRVVEMQAFAKTSKAGKEYEGFDLKVEICKGDYAGRMVWHMIIHTHPNSQTEEIGRGQLSQIWRALGAEGPCDSEFFAGVVGECLLAGVKIEKGKDGYSDKNRLSFFDTCTESCDDCRDGASVDESPEEIW